MVAASAIAKLGGRARRTVLSSNSHTETPVREKHRAHIQQSLRPGCPLGARALCAGARTRQDPTNTRAGES